MMAVSIETSVESNARAIANLRQEISSGITPVEHSQAISWDAIAHANRAVDRVTQNQSRISQNIDRLRTGQEIHPPLLDDLLGE